MLSESAEVGRLELCMAWVQPRSAPRDIPLLLLESEKTGLSEWPAPHMMTAVMSDVCI